MNKKIKQIAGFTLIELMISIVLSSFFIAGITQVFTRTSQNFRTQKTLSNMSEDARFAMDKLNSEFRRVGFLSNILIPGWDRSTIYHNKMAVDFNAGIYTIRNDGDTAAGSLMTMGVNETIQGSTNATGLGSDNVVTRYQLGSGAELTDNQYSPCTSGFALVAGELDTHRHVITMVFYMANNVLSCRAFRENLDTNDTELLAAIPLISNVERFRILYGQTDGSGGTLYRTNAEVTASVTPNWERIISTRLSLILHSEETNLANSTPGNYLVNGKKPFSPNYSGEKRLYRVFSTTAAFRNEVL